MHPLWHGTLAVGHTEMIERSEEILRSYVCMQYLAVRCIDSTDDISNAFMNE